MRYSKNYSDNRFNTKDDMIYSPPPLQPENTFASQTLPSFAYNKTINTNTTDTIPDIHHHPIAANNYNSKQAAILWSENNKNKINIPNDIQ